MFLTDSCACHVFSLVLFPPTSSAFQRDAHTKWENELMKDVPGWDAEPNVYKTRSFMQPVVSQPAYSR